MRSIWPRFETELLRQLRRNGGMARAGIDDEPERPLTVDVHRRDDATGAIETRGRGE